MDDKRHNSTRLDASLEEAWGKIGIVFLYPGLPELREEHCWVEKRDPKRHAGWRENAIGFYYYEIVSANLLIDGKLVVTTTAPRNISGRYYIGAQILTTDEEETFVGGPRPLDRSSEYVVRCRDGSHHWFNPVVDRLVGGQGK